MSDKKYSSEQLAELKGLAKNIKDNNRLSPEQLKKYIDKIAEGTEANLYIYVKGKLNKIATGDTTALELHTTALKFAKINVHNLKRLIPDGLKSSDSTAEKKTKTFFSQNEKELTNRADWPKYLYHYTPKKHVHTINTEKAIMVSRRDATTGQVNPDAPRGVYATAYGPQNFQGENRKLDIYKKIKGKKIFGNTDKSITEKNDAVEYYFKLEPAKFAAGTRIFKIVREGEDSYVIIPPPEHINNRESDRLHLESTSFQNYPEIMANRGKVDDVKEYTPYKPHRAVKPEMLFPNGYDNPRNSEATDGYEISVLGNPDVAKKDLAKTWLQENVNKRMLIIYENKRWKTLNNEGEFTPVHNSFLKNELIKKIPAEVTIISSGVKNLTEDFNTLIPESHKNNFTINALNTNGIDHLINDEHSAKSSSRANYLFDRMANGKALREHSFHFSQGKNLLFKLKKHIPEIGKYLVTGDEIKAKKFMEGVCVGLSTQYMIEERLNGPGGGKAYIEWLNQLIDSKINSNNRKFNNNEIERFKQQAHDDYNKQNLQAAIKEILDVQYNSNKVASDNQKIRNEGSKFYSNKIRENGLTKINKEAISLNTIEKSYNDFMNSLKKVTKNSYIDFMSNNHAMAITIHIVDNKKIWSFFDPNNGAKSFNNYRDFREFMDAFMDAKYYQFPINNNEKFVRFREYIAGKPPEPGVNLHRAAINNEPAFIVREFKNREKIFLVNKDTIGKIIDIEFGKIKNTEREDTNNIHSVTIELTNKTGETKTVEVKANNFTKITEIIRDNMTAIRNSSQQGLVIINEDGEITESTHLGSHNHDGSDHNKYAKPKFDSISKEKQIPLANHEHQIILQIEGDDVSLHAAEALYNKHPENSTFVQAKEDVLMAFSADGRQNYIDSQALEKALGNDGRLRLTLVGHGIINPDGDTTFGGRSVEQLRVLLNNIFAQLPKNNAIKGFTLNLAACNLDKISSNEKETFAQLIAELLPDILTAAGLTISPEKLELHARNQLITIDKDGHKMPMAELANELHSVRFKYNHETKTLVRQPYSAAELIKYKAKIEVLRLTNASSSSEQKQALGALDEEVRILLHNAIEQHSDLPAKQRDPALTQIIETAELHALGEAAWKEITKELPTAPKGFHYRIKKNNDETAKHAIIFKLYPNDPDANRRSLSTQDPVIIKTGFAYEKFMHKVTQMGHAYNNFVEKVNNKLNSGEAFDHAGTLNFAFLIQTAMTTDWKDWNKLSALDKAGSVIGMAQMVNGAAGDLAKIGSHVEELIRQPNSFNSTLKSAGLLTKASGALDVVASGFFLGKGIHDWATAKNNYQRNMAIIDTSQSGINLALAGTGLAFAAAAPWIAVATGPLIGIGFLVRAAIDASNDLEENWKIIDRIKESVHSNQQLIINNGIAQVNDYAVVEKVDLKNNRITYADIEILSISRQERDDSWGDTPEMRGAGLSTYNVFLPNGKREFNAFKEHDAQNIQQFILPSSLRGTVAGGFGADLTFGGPHSNTLEEIQKYYGEKTFKWLTRAGWQYRYFSHLHFVPEKTHITIELNKNIRNIIVPEVITAPKYYGSRQQYYSPEVTNRSYNLISYSLQGCADGNYLISLPDQYARNISITPSAKNNEHWSFQLDNRTSAARIQKRNEKFAELFKDINNSSNETILSDDLSSQLEKKLLLSKDQIRQWGNELFIKYHHEEKYIFNTKYYYNKSEIREKITEQVTAANQVDEEAATELIKKRLNEINFTAQQLLIADQKINFTGKLADNVHIQFRLPGADGVTFNLSAIKPQDNEADIRFTINLVLADLKSLKGADFEKIKVFINNNLSNTTKFSNPRFIQMFSKIGRKEIVGLIDLETGHWQAIDVNDSGKHSLYSKDNINGVRLPDGTASIIINKDKQLIINIHSDLILNKKGAKAKISYQLNNNNIENLLFNVSVNDLFNTFMVPNVLTLSDEIIKRLNNEARFTITSSNNHDNIIIGNVNKNNGKMTVTDLQWQDNNTIVTYHRNKPGKESLTLSLNGAREFNLSDSNLNHAYGPLNQLNIVTQGNTTKLIINQDMLDKLNSQHVNIIAETYAKNLSVVLPGQRLDYKLSNDGPDIYLIATDGRKFVLPKLIGDNAGAGLSVQFSDTQPMKRSELLQAVPWQGTFENTSTQSFAEYIVNRLRQLDPLLVDKITSTDASENLQVRLGDNQSATLKFINEKDKLTRTELHVNTELFNNFFLLKQNKVFDILIRWLQLNQFHKETIVVDSESTTRRSVNINQFCQKEEGKYQVKFNAKWEINDDVVAIQRDQDVIHLNIQSSQYEFRLGELNIPQEILSHADVITIELNKNTSDIALLTQFKQNSQIVLKGEGNGIAGTALVIPGGRNDFAISYDQNDAVLIHKKLGMKIIWQDAKLNQSQNTLNFAGGNGIYTRSQDSITLAELLTKKDSNDILAKQYNAEFIGEDNDVKYFSKSGYIIIKDGDEVNQYDLNNKIIPWLKNENFIFKSTRLEIITDVDPYRIKKRIHLEYNKESKKLNVSFNGQSISLVKNKLNNSGEITNNVINDNNINESLRNLFSADKFIGEYDDVKYFSQSVYLIIFNKNKVNYYDLTYLSNGIKTGIEQKELRFKAGKINIIGISEQFLLYYNKRSEELMFNALGENVSFKKAITKDFHLPIQNSDVELQHSNNNVLPPYSFNSDSQLMQQNNVSSEVYMRTAHLSQAINSYASNDAEIALSHSPRKENSALLMSVL